jgi:hypothetical protein
VTPRFSRPAAYLAVALVGRHMLAVTALYCLTVLMAPEPREDTAPTTRQESTP